MVHIPGMDILKQGGTLFNFPLLKLKSSLAAEGVKVLPFSLSLVQSEIRLPRSQLQPRNKYFLFPPRPHPTPYDAYTFLLIV
jgi:hypothetical protein